MSPLPAKVVAFEKGGAQYRLVVELVPKYRGSFNTLAFADWRIAKRGQDVRVEETEARINRKSRNSLRPL